MISFALFPNLTPQNHRITSPPTTDYNCVAWAAGDPLKWWQPGFYWPLPTDPLDESIDELKRVFRSLGYAECSEATLEAGFEKVALYADSAGYTHAARQVVSGRWTSKLGNEEDIEHDSPESVAGGVYGYVAFIMKRQSNGSS